MTQIDKVAIITGGSSGIGYGIAESLLKEGYNVAITSRSEARALEAVKKLKGIGVGAVIGLEVDVRSFDDQVTAVKEVVEKWGRVDVFVANAGVGHFASVADLSVEEWHETIDTNLTGPFYSIKASLEALKASKGYFITISSLAGTNFFEGASAYNASKFGLTGFTQAVMLDIRKFGIRVTTIMPGSVATAFNGHEVNDQDAWKIQKEDIGELVADILKMNSRSLPSKIEIRPSLPPQK
ncbi:SDR family oxidoreductase [Albibacterium sp.]|uniref:SDR family oxidoreductase n=1 Tax=Albibacterium sp. TaxID=2952885 RepID=UPI002C9FC40C|nr:SDR family oxidoreductase [Albibacterium sp.]HLT41624.1 SDR family oxidoreductase [Sphingobacteriaceae bacterium]HUH18708.1 SDR family oxidoreductase [Albibacterium sp.]